MNRSRGTLFCDKRFSEFRRKKLDEMEDDISSLSSDELQNNSTDSLSLIFASKYTPSLIEIQGPVKEDGGEVEKDVSDRRDIPTFGNGPTYVNYHRLEAKFSFNVDKDLFRHRPGRHDMNPPLYDELNRSEVVYYIDYRTENRNPEEIKNEIEKEVDSWVDKVEKYVSNLNSDIKSMQKKFRKKAQKAVERRRDEVQTKQQVMDELGVNSNESEDRGFVAPEKKREIGLPDSREDSNSRSEVLPDQTFVKTLEIIDDLGINIERSAERIRELDEESLRDIFLAGINSHYAGLATGESFNRGGKTDILLRYDNKNLFVAECKFWMGQSQYKDAIDQLLENLTVRDSHASLLVFSRRLGYDQMRNRVLETTKQHEQFVEEISEFADQEVFRFQLDSGNSVKIAVKTFDLLV